MEINETTWMSTREAATQLGLPPREIYRLIHVGDLPAHTDGRDLRLRADEVDAFAGGSD